jgi:ABC-2 type transport system ATP-binding protein
VAAHEVHATLREVMPGRTTLLCTHNLAEAEALCDEVVILRGGTVLLHAPLAELRQRAQPHLRLAAVQGAARLREALQRRGLSAEVVAGSDGVLVPVREPQAEAPALLRALLAEGLDVYHCQPAQATLEQLFLDVVRQEPHEP